LANPEGIPPCSLFAAIVGSSVFRPHFPAAHFSASFLLRNKTTIKAELRPVLGTELACENQANQQMMAP
jgi:hypothetical protein